MILITAGHVDHGKSTLVRALTGFEPDRLTEERRRGLTIDLGFAHMDVDGLNVDVIDAPGHHHFVTNALAGSHGADMVLMVVSAVEGWRAQSEEHLQIVDALGVQAGVIAVTHADLVGDDELQPRTEEIVAAVVGTCLETAPVIPTAHGDGNSIERLRQAIANQARLLTGRAAETEADARQERPRLWIDRSFTVAGAGRIVTGTLTGGDLEVGQAIDLASAAGFEPVRIRSLQAFGAATTNAQAGTRVGVGIVGPGIRNPPQRGDALVDSTQWQHGRVLSAWLQPVRGGPTSLTKRGGYHLHIGTHHQHARITWNRTDSGVDLVRLVVAQEIPGIGIGDRFVLRDESTATTVAGGVLLDIDQQRTRVSTEHLVDRYSALRSANRTVGLAHACLREAGGAMPAQLFRRAVGTDEVVGTSVIRGSAVMDSTLASVCRTIENEVARTGESSLPAGGLHGAVKATLAEHPDLLVQGARVVARADHGRSVELERARVGICDELSHHDPPLRSDGQLVAAGFGTRDLSDLANAGHLVRFDGWNLTTGTFNRLAGVVIRCLANGPATTSTLRQALCLPRNVTVQLLEEIDRRGLTHRDGDVRALGPSPTAQPAHATRPTAQPAQTTRR